MLWSLELMLISSIGASFVVILSLPLTSTFRSNLSFSLIHSSVSFPFIVSLATTCSNWLCLNSISQILIEYFVLVQFLDILYYLITCSNYILINRNPIVYYIRLTFHFLTFDLVDHSFYSFFI